MRALVCEAYGPVENLKVADLAVPEPKAGEILLRVGAAGVSFAALLGMQGLHPLRHADVGLAFDRAAGAARRPAEGGEGEIFGEDDLDVDCFSESSAQEFGHIGDETVAIDARGLERLFA